MFGRITHNYRFTYDLPDLEAPGHLDIKDNEQDKNSVTREISDGLERCLCQLQLLKRWPNQTGSC